MLVKCAAVAVFSALSSLLIKRDNPELSLAIGAASVCIILIACFSLLRVFDGFTEETGRILGAETQTLAPVLKCVGIAAISRFSAGLCRDASQSALAAAVETAGSICAAAVALPTILTVLTMIGSLI